MSKWWKAASMKSCFNEKPLWWKATPPLILSQNNLCWKRSFISLAPKGVSRIALCHRRRQIGLFKRRRPRRRRQRQRRVLFVDSCRHSVILQRRLLFHYSFLLSLCVFRFSLPLQLSLNVAQILRYLRNLWSMMKQLFSFITDAAAK